MSLIELSLLENATADATQQRQPLTPMQRAYLTGRSDQVPLGGIPMHDFREFRGSFLVQDLTRSVNEAVNRYACLRTIIDEHQLVQYIVDTDSAKELAKKNFQVIDLSFYDHQEADNRLDRIRKQYRQQMHSLDAFPWTICLVQMPIVSTGPLPNSVVFSSIDGLILDGFSVTQILGDIFSGEINARAAVVNANENNEASVNKNSAYFENRDADRDFWKQKIASIGEVNQLPWTQDLESIKQSDYCRYGISIKKSDWNNLSRLGFKHRLMQNALLLTLISEVLAQWSENGELALSLPISNSSLNGVPGNSSSFIVVSHSEQQSQPFVQKALAMQRQILLAMDHASFSGIELGKLMVQQTSKLISLPIALTNGLSWPNQYGAGTRLVDGITRTPQLALDIRITSNEQGDVLIDLDYATAALSGAVVKAVADAIKQRIHEIALLPDLANVADVQIKAIEEPKKESASERDLEGYTNFLQQMFQHLFVEPLSKAALIHGDKAYSYKEAGEAIAKIIHHLESIGMVKGNVVAICLPKSAEHVFATFACALAGYIWLPIDMDSPEERLQYLLANSEADLVICNKTFSFPRTENIHTILAHDVPKIAQREYLITAEPAYYLYTSGSTGRPKCVVLNNLATNNVLRYSIEHWNLSASNVHLAATPFHHDLFIFDVFTPFVVGGTLVVPTETENKSAADWAKLVARHSVNVWSGVPAIMDMLLAAAEPHQLSTLRVIIQGGDYVKPSVIKHLRSILPSAHLSSIGGPTETTIWSIWHDITERDVDVIPYGTSVPNNKYYILNEQNRHCPDWVTGTICMAGANLSNGYLMDGVLEMKDFVTVTSAQGNELLVFKTSDKGYLRDDGEIIIVGRKEGYLKVRGVRIASAEVEAALRKIPAIKDAAAFTCVNPVYEGNELVAAYITHQHEDISVKEFRRHLQGVLPNSHVPSRWLKLDAFPLTRNQKVDRKALAELATKKIYQGY